MICLNCGRNVNVVSRDCPYCHSPINMNTVTNLEQVKKQKNEYDCRKNKVLVLSMFIPPYGFFYYYKNKEDAPLSASSGIGGALIGCILYLLFICVILLGKIL